MQDAPDNPSDEPVRNLMDKELYYALTQVDIQRVHTTLTIDDFDCIKQDTRYIFYHNGDTKISILPLPPMKRKLQRNMNVEDSRTRKLVFIPSSSSADLLVNASTHILDAASQNLSSRHKPAFKEIRDNLQPALINVFTYEPQQSDIKLACEQIKKIQKEKDFLIKSLDILILADLLFQYRDGLYLPLIALIGPLQPKSYTLIHLSVERVREYFRRKIPRLVFNFLGRFTFSYELKIQRDISNHVRIYAPEGLVIKNVEFDLSEPESKESESKNPESKREETSCKDLKGYLEENKENYFDDRCFYIQIGPERSKTLYHCKKYINIRFGLSNLLKTLSILWWLTVLSPGVFGAFYWFRMLPPGIIRAILSDNFVLALLGLSATFLVAVGIYAIDKKIVKHFITTHIIFIYAVLAAEIIIMIYLN